MGGAHWSFYMQICCGVWWTHAPQLRGWGCVARLCAPVVVVGYCLPAVAGLDRLAAGRCS